MKDSKLFLVPHSDNEKLMWARIHFRSAGYYGELSSIFSRGEVKHRLRKMYFY